MYHCHVEALEHMQMGMLGNIFVRSAQDRLPVPTVFANGFEHLAGYRYAYDDGDGSTRYDVEVPLQIHSLDSYFHDQHLAVQPLPFYTIKDDYAMFNGRGYPDTVITTDLPGPNENGSKPVQKVHSRVSAIK
jgi:hypothetical protein